MLLWQIGLEIVVQQGFETAQYVAIYVLASDELTLIETSTVVQKGMNIDMRPFGIRFMLLEPGAFRTDFANADASMQLPDLQIEAYREAREKMAAIFSTMNGTQAGDPVKLARGLVKVVNSDDAPVRLLISKGAIPAIDAYYKARYAEFQKWQEVSADSDFEQ